MKKAVIYSRVSTTVQDYTSQTAELVKEAERQVEKARAFDPFGHAGFDPSGKIRMTP